MPPPPFLPPSLSPVPARPRRASLASAAAGGQGGTGTAAYLAPSLLNHSCLPNLDISFPRGDSRLRLSAARAIAAGEQLTISYIDADAGHRPRQDALLGGYGFECKCEKCAAGE